MNTRYKHYPHPVLQSQFEIDDENFKNSKFNVFINQYISEKDNEIVLETTFELENDTLKNLIDNDEAIFALLIICKSTSKRYLKTTNNKEEVLIVDAMYLNKTVSIYPYVLANKDINNYRNTDLIKPLNQFMFEIKRGDILAVAANYELYIEKNDVIEADSIFEFIEIERKNAPEMSFDPRSNKIRIQLPKSTYEKVRLMSGFRGSANHILMSLLYLPSVIYSLHSIVKLRSDVEGQTELTEFKDYDWYRTLEQKYRDLKLGDDLSDLSEDNLIDIAHKLMEKPNTKALDALDELLLQMGDE